MQTPNLDKNVIFFLKRTSNRKERFFTTYSFVLAGHVARYLAGLQPHDVLYNALPLYHSSAGMLALAPCYLYGLTVVLKPKFSVSSFWKDCVRYKATVS